MGISLSDKVAIVTGAASGIGREIALSLAKANAIVAVADVDEKVVSTKNEIERTGKHSVAVIFDVANVKAVEAGIAEIKRAVGPIDILVNNAGITTDVSPILKTTSEKWDRQMAVNLGGAFNCTKAVLPDMIKKKWGRIVMISSVVGVGGAHNAVAYSCSKIGMSGLAKTVTLEHAKDGVTCNTILCGLIASPNVLMLPEEMKTEYVSKRVPTGTIGDMEDIANAAVFLASEEAKYITGADLYVDGGAHLFTFSFGARHLNFNK
jgi:NAD(P)-dependent dehydrogenase (short-subunit alcohol dehydrogenase family)